MKRITYIIIAILFVSFLFCASAQSAEPRGRYIYDDANRLSPETEMSFSSYLLGIDQRTNYEFIIVFPSSTLEEEEIIDWFNNHGVGKSQIDNGAALFIFPDNSWFMSIGSGNDKVSVPYSKTQGDKILSNLDDDFALSILRYIDVIGSEIDEPISKEMTFIDIIAINLDIIFGVGAIIALVIFLIQQLDGFHWHDFILSGIFLLALLTFVGINAMAGSIESSSYENYGIITDTDFSERDFTRTVMVSTGKTSVPVTTWHTEYKNTVTFLSYELKSYTWTYRSEDNKRAWQHTEGEVNKLYITIDSDHLVNVNSISDNSGGKTIGDGVWS